MTASALRLATTVVRSRGVCVKELKGIRFINGFSPGWYP